MVCERDRFQVPPLTTLNRTSFRKRVDGCSKTSVFIEQPFSLSVHDGQRWSPLLCVQHRQRCTLAGRPQCHRSADGCGCTAAASGRSWHIQSGEKTHTHTHCCEIAEKPKQRAHFDSKNKIIGSLCFWNFETWSSHVIDKSQK